MDAKLTVIKARGCDGRERRLFFESPAELDPGLVGLALRTRAEMLDGEKSLPEVIGELEASARAIGARRVAH